MKMQTEQNTTGLHAKTTAQKTNGSSDANTAESPGGSTPPTYESVYATRAVPLLQELECPRCHRPGVYREKELKSFLHRDQMDGIRCGNLRQGDYRSKDDASSKGKRKAATLGLMAQVREWFR